MPGRKPRRIPWPGRLTPLRSARDRGGTAIPPDFSARASELEAGLDQANAQRDVARRQRDDARDQRDIAREQRDEARDQRDAARGALERLRAPSAFNYQALDRYVETGGREGSIPGSVAVDSPFGRALMSGRYIRPSFIVHSGYEHPPPGVAFAAVCNDKFFPGLEALVLSLRRVYPDLSSPFIVFHDHTLSPFVRRRLASVYPHFEFREASADSYDVAFGDAYNHRRVGRLGYLSLEALAVDDVDRLILLDADLLVLGDISPLWHGEEVNAVIDIGVRPFGVVSTATDRPVINSGVLSLPARERGPQAVARAREVLARLDGCPCEVLNLYADQKFWNLFLADRPVNHLPNTFNANKALVEMHFPEELHNVSVLHVTGAKPWYRFTNEHLLNEEDRVGYRRARVEFARSFALWDFTYRRELARIRVRSFLATMGRHLDEMQGAAEGRPCVLIGNGPSLSRTDLSRFDGYVKMGFNWFVHHEDFDEVAVDHLVLSSHMFFGGWHTPEPRFPDGFLEALRAHRHRPVIWVSFFFREYIEASGVLDDYEVRYLLFEKPLKAPLEQVGRARMDIRSFLLDAHTGVLTAGVPLAVHLGCSAIVLTGCDSNYSQAPAGDYFYADTAHTSPTTNYARLTDTWLADGPGPYCYRLILEALKEMGIPFRDATIGGALQVVPKLSMDQVPTLARA